MFGLTGKDWTKLSYDVCDSVTNNSIRVMCSTCGVIGYSEKGVEFQDYKCDKCKGNLSLGVM